MDATVRPATPPFARERWLLLGLLLVLTAAAWALVVRQAGAMDAGMVMRPTMGMGAPLFLALWVVMMVATMFPSAAPMVLTFARVHAGKRERRQPWVPIWVFVGGYLVVWTLLGAVAYLAAVAAEQLADRSPWLMVHGGQVGGVLLVAAGLYQLTPLKRRCLARCRSPLAFVVGSWREGYGGAFRMGLEHGLFCAGCCWLLFVVLFPLGMLNLAALAAVTALVFAEKTLPVGRQVAWAAAAALVAYGLVLMAGA